MSVAYLQHPMIFAGTPTNGYQQYPIKQQQPSQQQFAKQKQCLMPRRNYQQMMWHARSMESGLGKIPFDYQTIDDVFFVFFRLNFEIFLFHKNTRLSI